MIGTKRITSDYSKSKIYLIYCLTNEKLCYIGSTGSIYLNSRWNGHKQSYKQGEETLLYQTMRQHGGIENFTIKLIKECDCKNRKELKEIEQRYMFLFKTTLNTNKANNDKKEYDRNFQLKRKILSKIKDDLNFSIELKL